MALPPASPFPVYQRHWILKVSPVVLAACMMAVAIMGFFMKGTDVTRNLFLAVTAVFFTQTCLGALTGDYYKADAARRVFTAEEIAENPGCVAAHTYHFEQRRQHILAWIDVFTWCCFLAITALIIWEFCRPKKDPLAPLEGQEVWVHCYPA